MKIFINLVQILFRVPQAPASVLVISSRVLLTQPAEAGLVLLKTPLKFLTSAVKYSTFLLRCRGERGLVMENLGMAADVIQLAEDLPRVRRALGSMPSNTESLTG